MRNIALLAAASALTIAPRAFANAATKPRVEPVLTGSGKLALPTRESKRGSVSLYPFDSLTEVGMAFGVTNKTAAQLSSIVSNQNRKHLVPVKDANGNPTFKTKEIKGADGATMNVPDTDKPITEAAQHYFAFDVTPEYRKENADAFKKGGAFEGATTLVFRDK